MYSSLIIALFCIGFSFINCASLPPGPNPCSILYLGCNSLYSEFTLAHILDNSDLIIAIDDILHPPLITLDLLNTTTALVLGDLVNELNLSVGSIGAVNSATLTDFANKALQIISLFKLELQDFVDGVQHSGEAPALSAATELLQFIFQVFGNIQNQLSSLTLTGPIQAQVNQVIQGSVQVNTIITSTQLIAA